jgi:hypothetical protein
MVAVNQNIIKAPGLVTFTSLNPASNGIVIPMPNTATFSYNANIEVTEVPTNTVTGVTVRARLIETSANPEVTITLPTTPIALAMAFNAEWEDATNQTIYITKQQTLTSNTIAAATSGNEGYGIAADAESKASYIDPADPSAVYELTQVTYGTFNPAVTDDSFAVGANGAIKVSDNVVALAPMAQFRMPNVLTVRQFGESTFDTFKVEAKLIMVDLSIVQLTFPSLQVKPDSRAFDPSSGSVELVMAALNDGSTCNYNPTVQYLGQAQLINC